MINRIDLSGCGRRCRVEQNRASGHAANLKLVGHFINQDEFFISAWFKIPQKAKSSRVRRKSEGSNKLQLFAVICDMTMLFVIDYGS